MASGEIEITPGRVLGATELITPQKLNDLGVPIGRVKQAAITARELADGSISSDKLDVNLEAQIGVADGSVTTSKIVDKNVTAAKLADDLMTAQTSVATVNSADLLLWWDTALLRYRQQTYAALLAQLQAAFGPTILTGTLTHDPGSIASLATTTFNITVTGAVTTNNPVAVCTASINLNAQNIQLQESRVSGANTVSFIYYNFGGASVNLPSHTVRAVVFQY
jgi:hypothetical protein